MNWKLILFLSMFGLFMGLATVFVIPSNIAATGPLAGIGFGVIFGLPTMLAGKLFFARPAKSASA